ncbi:MAG: class I SAM-dependent methyltransferase [Clostridiales bacterium]
MIQIDYTKFAKWNDHIEPFSINTRMELWTFPHTANRMLEVHLDDNWSASRPISHIRKSVDFIVNYFNLKEGNAVCDLGCGPGLYTNYFAKRKIHTTGIDFSKNSIDYAKNKAKEDDLLIDYRIMNYKDFNDENKYDLITMIYCDYGAIGKNERKNILKNVKVALKNNGYFLFDVMYEPGFCCIQPEKNWNYVKEDGFWFEDEYIEIYEKVLYKSEKVTLGKHYISSKQEDKIIYNWDKYFSLDEIKNELENEGFKIVDTFSDTKGTVLAVDSEIITIVAKI